MSLKTYNEHATFGPSAGPATTAAASAGQAAYERAHAPRSGGAPGIYVPPTPTKPPKFLEWHAFKRGLAVLVVSQIALTAVMALGDPRSGVVGASQAVFIVAGLFGLFMMLWGALSFLGRRRKQPEG
jgi:hypothetical protein